MKITDISIQVKNKDRVNVSVDGKYCFSLDIFQLGELGVKLGREYTDEELTALETESQFGKLYGRALEYTLMRLHSAKEVRDYLWRKTRTVKLRRKDSNELYDKPGVPQSIADKVYERLFQKGYIDDEKFARFWVENRNQAKGVSSRKLIAELRTKGVEQSIIALAIEASSRVDNDEIKKIIAKKRRKYDDEQKLIAYLARQGFSYDDIKTALADED